MNSVTVSFKKEATTRENVNKKKKRDAYLVEGAQGGVSSG